jgi:hypothetical protein
MFGGCTSLTAAPALPATILYTACYAYMFCECANIKLSRTQTGDYQTAYRIPVLGTGQGQPASSVMLNMFSKTGGTFTGTPEINTTYYIAASDPVSVYE